MIEDWQQHPVVEAWFKACRTAGYCTPDDVAFLRSRLGLPKYQMHDLLTSSILPELRISGVKYRNRRLKSGDYAAPAVIDLPEKTTPFLLPPGVRTTAASSRGTRTAAPAVATTTGSAASPHDRGPSPFDEFHLWEETFKGYVGGSGDTLGCAFLMVPLLPILACVWMVGWWFTLVRQVFWWLAGSGNVTAGASNGVGTRAEVRSKQLAVAGVAVGLAAVVAVVAWGMLGPGKLRDSLNGQWRQEGTGATIEFGSQPSGVSSFHFHSEYDEYGAEWVRDVEGSSRCGSKDTVTLDGGRRLSGLGHSVGPDPYSVKFRAEVSQSGVLVLAPLEEEPTDTKIAGRYTRVP